MQSYMYHEVQNVRLYSKESSIYKWSFLLCDMIVLEISLLSKNQRLITLQQYDF